jgi:hypothetical protein
MTAIVYGNLRVEIISDIGFRTQLETAQKAVSNVRCFAQVDVTCPRL